MGSVTASTDLVVGQNKVSAGEYKMYFSVMAHEGNPIVFLNLKAAGSEDADPIRWRCAMTESGQNCKRIRFELIPGDDANTAHINMMFGKQKMAKLVDVSRDSGQ